METLNKNGVSITQTPGEEKYVKCCLSAFRGQIYFQYDYRHIDMELFSTVTKTLDECRKQRDEWIARKKKYNNNLKVTFMKTTEVNNKIIGRRCKCIFTGLLVTGVIEAVEENVYSVQVKVCFDTPRQ